jgi:hypothetical protein
MNIPAADNLHLVEDGAMVTIPLEYNLNDKGCLFAGSLFAGAILAAYRAAERLFAEQGQSGALVAKTASVHYLKRIVSDGRATVVECGEPVSRANGNQALSVTVGVLDSEHNRCAELTAEFILLRERSLTADAGR